MSDILEQIQDLQEKFASLCEVEGLGEPSQEVPPSTNKLKKDVKTKNGKVELVSVENELFPYEGNKKEQFQQKVLDTINGMIQGTKTLEDLLQVVRSKKVAPVKEGIEEFAKAAEILEELINEVSTDLLKAAAIKSAEDRKEELIGKANSSTKELQKAEDRYAHAQALADTDMKIDTKVPANKLFKAASKSLEGREVDKASKKYERARELATNDPVASRREENIKGINKRFIDSFKKKNSSEALEEALKIIEGLFIKDGRGDLLDDVSNLLTGKTLKQHAQAAITKAVSGLTKKSTKKRK